MRPLLTGLLVLGLSGFAARADEKPLTVKQSLDELKKELEAARKKHGLDLQKAQKAIRDAKDDQKTEAQKKLAAVQADAPAPVYAVKFLELAEKNPTDPAALGALSMAWETAKVGSKDGPVTPKQKATIRLKVLTLLQHNWLEKPAIRGLLPLVANPNDALSSQLLVTVMAKNPERKVQALSVGSCVSHSAALR